MSAQVTAGRGDVGGAGFAEQADRHVAPGGHDGWAVAGPDLGQVFAVGDVADPVQSVLDAPVPAQGVSEFGRAGLLGGQIGDRVDRFGAPPAAGQDRLRRVICSARAACGKLIPTPRPW